MLTGLFSPTSGEAHVGGFSILDDMESVHSSMGLCPQFDVLYNDLTVKEHLLFYARLRGVPLNEEKKQVLQLINDVGLTLQANQKAGTLSGGMKRRLSIAIALIGNPKIVLLDEPTT